MACCNDVVNNRWNWSNDDGSKGKAIHPTVANTYTRPILQASKSHVQAYVRPPASPRSLVHGRRRHAGGITNSKDDLRFPRSKQNSREESWVIGFSAA